MIRYIALLLFIFLYGCSFNTNSRFWTEEKEVEKLSKNISKILEKKLITKKEFNPNLKIDTSKKFRSISDDLSNNLAIKNFNKDIDKIYSPEGQAKLEEEFLSDSNISFEDVSEDDENFNPTSQ